MKRGEFVKGGLALVGLIGLRALGVKPKSKKLRGKDAYVIFGDGKTLTAKRVKH